MLDHLSHAFHTFPLFAFVGFKPQLMRPVAVGDLARIIKAALAEGRLTRKTVAVTGPEELTLEQAVRRVGSVVGKTPFYFKLPVAFHYGLAWVCEKLMKVPLISKAQVMILSEGLIEPGTECDALPDDLVPQQLFSEAIIQEGLPPAKRFGVSDLRNPCAYSANTH